MLYIYYSFGFLFRAYNPTNFQNRMDTRLMPDDATWRNMNMTERMAWTQDTPVLPQREMTTVMGGGNVQHPQPPQRGMLIVAEPNTVMVIGTQENLISMSPSDLWRKTLTAAPRVPGMDLICMSSKPGLFEWKSGAMEDDPLASLEIPPAPPVSPRLKWWQLTPNQRWWLVRELIGFLLLVLLLVQAWTTYMVIRYLPAFPPVVWGAD